LYIDPALAKRSYLERLSSHNEKLHEICRNQGASFHLVPTDRPLERSLMEFLLDRRKLGKALRRRMRK
jgi:hypothetical protein